MSEQNTTAAQACSAEAETEKPREVDELPQGTAPKTPGSIGFVPLMHSLDQKQHRQQHHLAFQQVAQQNYKKFISTVNPQAGGELLQDDTSDPIEIPCLESREMRLLAAQKHMFQSIKDRKTEIREKMSKAQNEQSEPQQDVSQNQLKELHEKLTSQGSLLSNALSISTESCKEMSEVQTDQSKAQDIYKGLREKLADQEKLLSNALSVSTESCEEVSKVQSEQLKKQSVEQDKLKVFDEKLNNLKNHLQDQSKKLREELSSLDKTEGDTLSMTDALSPNVDRYLERYREGIAGEVFKPMDVRSVMNPMDGHEAHKFQEIHPLRLNPTNDQTARTFSAASVVHPSDSQAAPRSQENTLFRCDPTNDDMVKLKRYPGLKYRIDDQAAPRTQKHPFIGLTPDDVTKSKFPEFSISRPKSREEDELPQSTVGTGLDDSKIQSFKIMDKTRESNKLGTEAAFVPLHAELRETMGYEAMEKRAKVVQNLHLRTIRDPKLLARRGDYLRAIKDGRLRMASLKEYKPPQSVRTSQGIIDGDRAILNSLLMKTLDLANEDTMDRSKLLSKLWEMINVVNDMSNRTLFVKELGLSTSDVDAHKHATNLSKALDAWREEICARVQDRLKRNRAHFPVADALLAMGIHPPMIIPNDDFLWNLKLYTPSSLRSKAKEMETLGVSDTTHGDNTSADQNEDEGFVVV